MRSTNGTAPAPWGTESAEPGLTVIPSWLAPRRMSLMPLVLPRSTMPPTITHAHESGTPQSVRPSARPGALSLPPFATPAAPYPDLREENALLRAELGQALTAITKMRRELLEASEAEVVTLACAVAQRVAGRELAADRSLVVTWAREALTVLASNDKVVVVVAPDLAESIPTEMWAQLGVPCRIEVDPTLLPAHCEVRSGSGRVEVGLEIRLASVAIELGVEAR